MNTAATSLPERNAAEVAELVLAPEAAAPEVRARRARQRRQIYIGQVASYSLGASVLMIYAYDGAISVDIVSLFWFGGLLIIGVGRLAPPARKPVLVRIGVAGAVVWATLFVVFNLWELATFLLGDNEDHPTFTVLTGPAMRWFPSRVALSLLWLAIGWRALER